VQPRTTEWFAFFYVFAIFPCSPRHVPPLLLVSRASGSSPNSGSGRFLVYAVAHAGYMAVPVTALCGYLAGTASSTPGGGGGVLRGVPH